MTTTKKDETVWAVCEFDTSCDDLDSHDRDEGQRVLAIYASEQTAKQYAGRGGGRYVTQMPIRTKVKDY